MKLKCMILEDEPLAMQQIRAYVEKTPFLSLVASASDATQGIDLFNESRPDLLFADINMPELSGIDFVKTLKDPPLIIFTTAYREYAIEGFRVDAVDYLLKPIGYADFLKAANKARRFFELSRLPVDPEPDAEDKPYLYVRSDHKLVKVWFSDIEYIESMREYIRIHLVDKPPVMTLLAVKTIEERLPKDNFLRVHRSFIVNLEKITEVRQQQIFLDKDISIPIGSQYKDEFEDYIGRNFL